MKKIHLESRGTYGLPRIHSQLKQDGKFVGKSRVGRLMKKAGICGLIRLKFRVKTTDSKHDLPIAPRIFQTEEPTTHPTKPNQVWASDISYIHTGEGLLYLATYLDLCTRKVPGFAIEDHMRTELLLQALDMALGRQKLTAGDILGHSDRGSQYAS
jgi:transposase InsO family protein